VRAALLLLLLVGCDVYAPWDEPERYHCVCEREVDGSPEAGAHWIVMYTCSNESAGRNEEVALNWCDANLQSCIDCACESQGEACS